MHAVDGFFDGPGDGDHHLIDGHDAVVDPDQHAREIVEGNTDTGMVKAR